MATRSVLAWLVCTGCVLEEPSSETTNPATQAAPASSGGGSWNPGSGGGGSSTSSSSPTFAPAVCDLPRPSSLTVSCDAPIDAVAVADCAAGGHAALLAGVGYATIADAISDASAGNTVQVCPGTWAGPVLVDREITLAAADPTDGVTVIDGAGDRAMEVSATSTVVGLTIRNGSRPDDVGGVLVYAPDVVLECMTIENNNVGLGAYWETGTLVLRTSTLRNNVSTYGGGAANIAGNTTIERSAFYDNYADYEGGALSWGTWENHTLEVLDSAFHCNASGYEGGALDIGTWADDTVHIVGSSFTGNWSSYTGGAIEFGSWGRIDTTIRGTTFSDNMSSAAGAIDIGGWLDNGFSAALDGVLFVDNTAQWGGSAISIGGVVSGGQIDGVAVQLFRNTGGEAAVELNPGNTFDCTGCDAGTGADDNAPLDATNGATTYPTLPPDFSI